MSRVPKYTRLFNIQSAFEILPLLYIYIYIYHLIKNLFFFMNISMTLYNNLARYLNSCK